MLPTVEDMLIDFQWVRFDLKRASKNPNKEPTVSDVCDVLACKIKDIWCRASIPTVSVTRIIQLIKYHRDKLITLLRQPASRRNKRYKTEVNDFRELVRRKLFDVSACECADFSSCKCEKSKKVPVLE